MYSFRDITDHTDITNSLPSEAVSINGQYIENVLSGYRTLYTKGRESLGVEITANSVGIADGEKYKYYIRQAGGFGERAKKRHAYIVYQNGTIAVAKNAKVEPGCEIVVPTKAPRDASALQQWLSIGTTAASLTTMFATIYNILK